MEKSSCAPRKLNFCCAEGALIISPDDGVERQGKPTSSAVSRTQQIAKKKREGKRALENREEGSNTL